MARVVECPKCGQDISDTYEPADPDVGIMMGGWFCDPCGVAVADDEEPEHFDDDVPLFGGDQYKDDHSGLCQYCRTPLEVGYGLAGGGMGPYMYCPSSTCGKTLIKSRDPT